MGANISISTTEQIKISVNKNAFALTVTDTQRPRLVRRMRRLARLRRTWGSGRVCWFPGVSPST